MLFQVVRIQSLFIAILRLDFTDQVLRGLNNSINVMSKSYPITMCAVKKILKFWMSEGASWTKASHGHSGTCESICQKPGSGVLQLLQPGHC